MYKKVGNVYYVHKSNRKELLSLVPSCALDKYKAIVYGLDGMLNYDVIKYDSYMNTVSFIQSPDWFTENEPTVGDSEIYYLDTIKHLNYALAECEHRHHKESLTNPNIYHSKWMFMADDYDYEWIAKAKERTTQWNKLNLDKKRIGHRLYWNEQMDKYGLER